MQYTTAGLSLISLSAFLGLRSGLINRFGFWVCVLVTLIRKKNQTKSHLWRWDEKIKKYRQLGRFKYRLLQSLYFSDNWRDIAPGSIIFINQDINRNELIKGKWFDRYLDSTATELERLAIRRSFLGEPFSVKVNEISYQNVHSMNRLSAKELILKRVFGKWLCKFSCLNAYVLVFKKLQPRAVITIWPSPSFIQAANALRVPTVAMMHGKGLTYDVYNWSKRERAAQPDHVITYDLTSFQTYAALLGKDRVHLAIDPWNEWATENHKLFDPPPFSVMSYRRRVLFTLGGKYGIDHGPDSPRASVRYGGLIPDEILEAMKNSPSNWLWMVRMHPGHREPHCLDWYQETLNRLAVDLGNIEYKWTTFTPLIHVIREASHHITLRSSSVYDSVAVGLPTLVISKELGSDLPGGDYFSELFDEGVLEIRKNGAIEILEWIELACAREDPQKASIDVDMNETLKTWQIICSICKIS